MVYHRDMDTTTDTLCARDLAQLLTIMVSTVGGVDSLFAGGCSEPGCRCDYPVTFIARAG